MALIHRTATITAAAQSLRTLLGLSDADDPPFAIFSLQGGTAAAEIFVGGAGVTPTNFLWRIPAAAAGVPAEPIILQGNYTIRLSEVFVVGTAGNLIHAGGFVN